MACGQSSSAASIWPARGGARTWLRAAAPAPSAGSPGCMHVPAALPAECLRQRLPGHALGMQRVSTGALAGAQRARQRTGVVVVPVDRLLAQQAERGLLAPRAAAHRCGCCLRRSPACPAGRARAARAVRAPPAAWQPPAAPGWHRSARGCRGRRPSPARCAAGPARSAALLRRRTPLGAGPDVELRFQGTRPRLCSLHAERHGHDLLRELLFLQPDGLLERRTAVGAQGGCTGLPGTSVQQSLTTPVQTQPCISAQSWAACLYSNLAERVQAHLHVRYIYVGLQARSL